jgi:hypothetical protein
VSSGLWHCGPVGAYISEQHTFSIFRLVGSEVIKGEQTYRYDDIISLFFLKNKENCVKINIPSTT